MHRLAALFLSAVLAACGRPDTDTSPDTDGAETDAAPGCFALADGACVEETFHNPPVLQPDADGVYQLELGPVEFTFDGQRHCGRAYNGMFPGPTIETAAHDGTPRHIRVDVRNTFTKPAYRSLHEGTCTCTDTFGNACTPVGHGHDEACTCVDEEGESCHRFDFNTTNLHAHGSHVRPDYAAGAGCTEHDGMSCRLCSSSGTTGKRECFYADDVISRVAPGQGNQHRWDIDEDGVAHEGLNWYHPHIHGSTAIQVASGATGAWIVRGPVDELPGIADARERLFLISTPPVTLPPLADGQACDEDHITFDDFPTLGSTSDKQTNLINGLRQPRLVMAPGSVERWRFLHGSFLDEMTIAVFHGKDRDCAALDFAAGPVALTQIGRDGLTLPRPPGDQDWPFAPPYVFLSPGYRIDTILDGRALEDGDTLCLMSGRFLQEDTTGVTDIAVGLTDPPTLDELLQATFNGDLIGIVNVATSAGPAPETELPDFATVAEHSPSMSLQGGTVDALTLCAEKQAVTRSDEIDQLSAMWMIFAESDGLDECACPDHNLNCRNFEHTDRTRYPYDRVFELGDVEHWRLVAGFDGHPFHIHINPYLVCPLPPAGSSDPSVTGRLFEPPFAHWRDTYLVNLTRKVDVLTEYRAFAGDFVYHCHKLNHEDHGMMELVRVCDPAVEACDTLCDGRPCGWDECADGDVDCEKARAFAACFVDPTQCPEALLRCTTCKGEDLTCPKGAHCADVANEDGELRCLPGCEFDFECLNNQVCGEGGTCELAPPCPPCGPGGACVHGVCE